MFGGYVFYLPTQEVPPWGSSPRACHARIGVVDRTVDINGMRLHVKALGALGALSWCLSAQNRRSCQLGQLGKNQFLAWIKNFFWNILDISASINWGEDGDDSWKESSILCGNIANVRKHHRKSKICTSCPFVLNKLQWRFPKSLFNCFRTL